MERRNASATSSQGLCIRLDTDILARIIKFCNFAGSFRFRDYFVLNEAVAFYHFWYKLILNTWIWRETKFTIGSHVIGILDLHEGLICISHDYCDIRLLEVKLTAKSIVTLPGQFTVGAAWRHRVKGAVFKGNIIFLFKVLYGIPIAYTIQEFT